MVPAGTQVWACTTPTDLRKGFNGLVGLVARQFRLDILDGGCFLFVNAHRTSAKILYWDGTGLCLLSKRLAKGRFPLISSDADVLELRLTDRELNAFLHGFKQDKSSISPGRQVAGGIGMSHA